MSSARRISRLAGRQAAEEGICSLRVIEGAFCPNKLVPLPYPPRQCKKGNRLIVTAWTEGENRLGHIYMPVIHVINSTVSTNRTGMGD